MNLPGERCLAAHFDRDPAVTKSEALSLMGEGVRWKTSSSLDVQALTSAWWGCLRKLLWPSFSVGVSQRVCKCSTSALTPGRKTPQKRHLCSAVRRHQWAKSATNSKCIFTFSCSCWPRLFDLQHSRWVEVAIPAHQRQKELDVHCSKRWSVLSNIPFLFAKENTGASKDVRKRKKKSTFLIFKDDFFPEIPSWPTGHMSF